ALALPSPASPSAGGGQGVEGAAQYRGVVAGVLRGRRVDDLVPPELGRLDLHRPVRLNESAREAILFLGFARAGNTTVQHPARTIHAAPAAPPHGDDGDEPAGEGRPRGPRRFRDGRPRADGIGHVPGGPGRRGRRRLGRETAEFGLSDELGDDVRRFGLRSHAFSSNSNQSQSHAGPLLEQLREPAQVECPPVRVTLQYLPRSSVEAHQSRDAPALHPAQYPIASLGIVRHGKPRHGRVERLEIRPARVARYVHNLHALGPSGCGFPHCPALVVEFDQEYKVGVRKRLLDFALGHPPPVQQQVVRELPEQFYQLRVARGGRARPLAPLPHDGRRRRERHDRPALVDAHVQVRFAPAALPAYHRTDAEHVSFAACQVLLLNLVPRKARCHGLPLTRALVLPHLELVSQHGAAAVVVVRLPRHVGHVRAGLGRRRARVDPNPRRLHPPGLLAHRQDRERPPASVRHVVQTFRVDPAFDPRRCTEMVRRIHAHRSRLVSGSKSGPHVGNLPLETRNQKPCPAPVKLRFLAVVEDNSVLREVYCSDPPESIPLSPEDVAGRYCSEYLVEEDDPIAGQLTVMDASSASTSSIPSSKDMIQIPDTVEGLVVNSAAPERAVVWFVLYYTPRLLAAYALSRAASACEYLRPSCLLAVVCLTSSSFFWHLMISGVKTEGYRGLTSLNGAVKFVRQRSNRVKGAKGKGSAPGPAASGPGQGRQAVYSRLAHAYDSKTGGPTGTTGIYFDLVFDRIVLVQLDRRQHTAGRRTLLTQGFGAQEAQAAGIP
ncbi:hypothetical protein THAOC_19482, partial [Thalassiosira oceanica]